MTRLRSLSFCSCLLALATIGGAQSPADALRAEAKSIAIADLPDDFRALTLGGGMELSPWMIFGGMSGGGSSKPTDRLLIRALGAIWVQPDEFGELLEGKRPRIRTYQIDVTALFAGGENPVPTFVESWLEAGRITAWSAAPELAKPELVRTFTRPAGPDGPFEAGAPPVPVNATERLQALKQISIAILMYSGDSDDAFPRATASAQLTRIVAPYLKSTEAFAPSAEGGRVLYNTYLVGEKSTSLRSPADTVLLWEERAWPDGRRAVAFTDGHAVRVNEAKWSKVWKRELARREEQRARQRRTA